MIESPRDLGRRDGNKGDSLGPCEAQRGSWMEDCLGDGRAVKKGLEGLLRGARRSAADGESWENLKQGAGGPGKERSLSCGDLGGSARRERAQISKKGLGGLDIHGEEIWKAGGHGGSLVPEGSWVGEQDSPESEPSPL